MEVLRWGYRIPFRRAPTLSKEPIPFLAYCPSSIRGKALEGEVCSLLEKGAIELAPLPSLSFYSRLFVVMKASGSWRPVIDLSLLNLKVLKTSFKMETLQSVMVSVRPGDWMVSLDLKDAYLQVPMHPESRKFLWFVALGKVYQFKVLCFGLSTAPQVFTRVMAPVSAFLHQAGIRLRRYLDDWLIQASSREQVLLALESVLQLCRQLGIVVNWEKSHLVPSQRVEYLGVLFDSVTFRNSPAQKRVLKLLSIGEEFLSCERQPASAWLELLGVLASLIQLIPGERLRMRSLQFCLNRSWDFSDQSLLIRWDAASQADLQWWLDLPLLESGISLSQISPQLELWSDASDVGWGAHLGGELTSGLWSLSEQLLSINARELLAVERALSFFTPQVQGSSNRPVRRQFYSDCLPSQSGGYSVEDSEFHCSTDSPVGGVSGSHSGSTVHLGPAQRDGGCSVSSQSGFGLRKVSEDRGLSGAPEEVAGVHRSLRHLSKSPLFTVFLSFPRSERGGHGCFASGLEWVVGVCLSSLGPHSCSPQEAPVIVWSPPDVDRSLLASASVVSGASGSGCGRSGDSSSVQRSSQTASLSSFPSGGVKAVSSCVETIQQIAQSQGFSRHVAQQSALARRPSSRAGYQARWAVFRKWCHDKGHSVSRPSLQKVADFLFWLRRSRKLSVSAVVGYRAMLSAVFRSVLPDISSSSVLQDLIRSFKVEVPSRVVRPPSWDLLRVLTYLRSPVFEPLHKSSLRDLSRKTLFLLALATAKRVGELQALSRAVSFSSSAAGISYIPEFLAKTESAVRSLPRSFSVPSLGDFAAGLPEDLLLCPVRSLREYVRRTETLVNCPRRLFVAPRCPSRAMSKNAISYFLREVIVQSGASSEELAAPKAHSIRGIATSSAFFRNWSLASVLDAASWRSNSVFTSFYFRDMQFVMDGVYALGPFVAVGQRIS